MFYHNPNMTTSIKPYKKNGLENQTNILHNKQLKHADEFYNQVIIPFPLLRKNPDYAQLINQFFLLHPCLNLFYSHN